MIDNNNGKYEKDYMKIKILNDDDIPLNKMIYFSTVILIIRCVFKKDRVHYPQIYLGRLLVSSIKTISYERIDKIEGINFEKKDQNV